MQLKSLLSIIAIILLVGCLHETNETFYYQDEISYSNQDIQEIIDNATLNVMEISPNARLGLLAVTVNSTITSFYPKTFHVYFIDDNRSHNYHYDLLTKNYSYSVQEKSYENISTLDLNDWKVSFKEAIEIINKSQELNDFKEQHKLSIEKNGSLRFFLAFIRLGTSSFFGLDMQEEKLYWQVRYQIVEPDELNDKHPPSFILTLFVDASTGEIYSNL